MVIMNVPVAIQEGKYREVMDALYEVAKSVGFKYDEKYDKYQNTQRSGVMISISQMMLAIASGELKVSVPKGG